MLVAGTNKASGPTNQAGQVTLVGQQGRWAGWIDAPAITANNFAAATNITHIHSKTGSVSH